MLSQVIKHTLLDKDACASLLGIDKEIFSEWAAGQRAVPESMKGLLASVFAVSKDAIGTSSGKQTTVDSPPAVWFKLKREASIQPADRECALITRQLGHLWAELEEATNRPQLAWDTLFKTIYDKTPKSLSFEEQGKKAAEQFLQETELSHGGKGIGEVLRPFLRNKGVLIIESDIRGDSTLEGFCFLVGDLRVRPCIFVNTYKADWFHRNFIICHELGHGIFDTETQGAAIDFEDASPESKLDSSEIRAQSFAQEVLLPERLLRHVVSTKGIKWNSLDERGLATLSAETHADAKLILRVAKSRGLISEVEFAKYNLLAFSTELKQLSDHALSGKEYIEKYHKPAGISKSLRMTTLTSRPVTLPPRYTQAVVEAVKDRQITSGRGAELLLIDRDDFRKRFPDCVPEQYGNDDE